MAGTRPVSLEYGSNDLDWYGKLLRQTVQNASILYTVEETGSGKQTLPIAEYAGLKIKAMPPYHPVLGHIPLMISLVLQLPRDAHAHYLPDQIGRRYPNLGPIYYLDAWPLAQPILVVTSPEIASQFSQADNLLPKHPGMRKFMRPVTGGLDLISMDGQTWKTWRGIFNPGFSATHMMSLIPRILEELSVFKDILNGHAEKGDIFFLDEATINASIDVIGRVAL